MMLMLRKREDMGWWWWWCCGAVVVLWWYCGGGGGCSFENWSSVCWISTWTAAWLVTNGFYPCRRTGCLCNLSYDIIVAILGSILYFLVKSRYDTTTKKTKDKNTKDKKKQHKDKRQEEVEIAACKIPCFSLFPPRKWAVKKWNGF